MFLKGFMIESLLKSNFVRFCITLTQCLKTHFSALAFNPTLDYCYFTVFNSLYLMFKCVLVSSFISRVQHFESTAVV